MRIIFSIFSLLLFSCSDIDGLTDSLLGKGQQESAEADSSVIIQRSGDGYSGNLRNVSSPVAVNIAPFNAWTPGWVLIDQFPPWWIYSRFIRYIRR